MTIKLKSHHDCDGLISGHFATFGITDSEIDLTADTFGDTKGLTKEDWMLDMKPNNPNWDGTCIDHHFPHPKERKYKLIPDIPDEYFHYANAIVPASLITFEYFKDKIPKEEWWKVAAGVCGDGQPELIPKEIFDMCPTLLKYVSTSLYQSYGQWKISTRPLYETLSSSLNAFLRKGEFEQAINIIKYSSTPLDIYNNDEVKMAKSDIRGDFTQAVKDADVFEFSNLAVVVFFSQYRMSGYIASSLQKELSGKTIMAVNKRDGSLSLRGSFASYYKNKLKPLSYLEIDGHAAFMGGKVKKNYTKLISDMSELIQ